MKEYSFAIVIDPVNRGQIYDHMPLHCTVIHWFRVNETPERIAGAAIAAIKGLAPVELISETFQLIGRTHDIPVHLIASDEALTMLHASLLTTLNEMGVEYTEPEYVGNGYRPHVAVRNGRSFSLGSRQRVEKIYLVEALNNKTPRDKEVRAIVSL